MVDVFIGKLLRERERERERERDNRYGEEEKEHSLVPFVGRKHRVKARKEYIYAVNSELEEGKNFKEFLVVL